MAYYESEVCHVHWDATARAVEVRWKGFATGEAYREALDASIDCLKANGGTKMYGDARELGTIEQDDQVWVGSDWAPRAEDAGLEHLAAIYPESVVAQMSVDSALEEFDDDINRDIFDDRDEAEAWLSRQ